MLLVVWSLAGTVVAVLAPALAYHLIRPTTRELHWTERARRLSPLRACVAVGGFALVPGTLWLGWQLGGWRQAVACTLASYVGLQLSARLIGLRALSAMEVPLPFDRGDARRSFVGALPLQLAWLGPFVTVALWPRVEALGVVAAALALVVLYVRYQSHWLLFAGHFRGAHSTVQARVAALTNDSRPPRGVFETQLGLANAMALPWSRELAITRGALHVLTEDELDAVISHELEHLDESALLRVSRLSMVLGRVLLGAVAGYTVTLDDLPLGLLLLAGAVGGAVVLWRVVMSLWSRGERDADHAGGAHDSAAYGRALIALYRANLYPVGTMSATGHAALHDRLTKLGVEPDFRPTRRVAQAPALATAALIIAYGVGMVAVAS